MRPSARQTVAIALVAVALCADRAVAASAPQHRTERTTLAGQIVRKLQVSFRRIVPSVDPFRERSTVALAPQDGRRGAVVPADCPIHPAISPLQTRLPPPLA